jgi:hypothetical protein
MSEALEATILIVIFRINHKTKSSLTDGAEAKKGEIYILKC